MVGFNSDIPTLFVETSAGIGTTGNIGVATTTPGAKLHVAGSIRSDVLAGGGNVCADANGDLYLSGACSSSLTSEYFSRMQQQIDKLEAQNIALEKQMTQLKDLLQGQMQQVVSECCEAQTPTGLETPSGLNTHLGQNIPNPFTNTTVIPYFLPESAGEAFIQITDLTGKVIQRFELQGGMNQVEFSNSSLAQGIYLYSLIADGKVVETKRMEMVN
jgi:hypothetical protein